MNETVKHNVGSTLMLGIPTLGRPVPLQWALNFKSLNPPINYNCDFNIILGKEIGFARNALAKAALERNCKYLFFIGDDVVVPPHALRQLIYRAENQPNVDVVGGIYCAKADPPAPLVFRGNGVGSYWDWKVGEFFECSGLGMDCTLIRTEIFSKLAEPWFCTVDKDAHIDGEPKIESWTEDLYFCNKVTEAGFKVWADASVICEHWDVYKNIVYRLPADSLPMRQKGVIKSLRCLVLGALPPFNDEILSTYDITRCVENASDWTADYRLSFDNLPFEKEQFDFLVVSEYILDLDRYLEEWKRVTKRGGKISFNLHPRLAEEAILDVVNGNLNGTYVELEVG